jgi:hypothetical protein
MRSWDYGPEMGWGNVAADRDALLVALEWLPVGNVLRATDRGQMHGELDSTLRCLAENRYGEGLSGFVMCFESTAGARAYAITDKGAAYLAARKEPPHAR